jgi:hypothetical protein
MGIHEIKRLLHSKGNSYQTEKTADQRMGRNLCQGNNNRIYLDLKKLNFQRIHDPMKKWENEQNRKFSNKYKWQKIT